MDEDDSYQFRKKVKLDLFKMRMMSPALSPGKVRWEFDSYDPDYEMLEIEKQKKQLEQINEDFILQDSPRNLKLTKQESYQESQSWQFQYPSYPFWAEPEQEQKPVTQITQIKVESDKKKKKFKNKNFCRYIILSAFRTLEKEMYEKQIMEICDQFQVDFERFKSYYIKQRPVIMGYQLLRKELIANDTKYEVNQRKKAFKQFMIFYLDRIATKDILSSKKGDTKEYILYKNNVMTYYVKNPEQWQGNSADWQNKK